MLILIAWILPAVLLFPNEEIPGSWLGCFKLAEKALEAGALDDGIHYLESCLEFVPENAITAYHLACAHARSGRVKAALEWLEKSVERGWADAGVMRWDKDLEPLRSRDGFENP